MSGNSKILTQTLAESDPELSNLMKEEKKCHTCTLEMVASENFTSLSVLQCVSSIVRHKYCEGRPFKRYHGGELYVEKIQHLAQKRSLEAFDLNPEEWGVNVQPYSGSIANLIAYTGVCKPHDRIMGLDLLEGGHLTHGFFTPTQKIAASSIFFETMPYKLDPKTGLIDYDELEKSAKLFKPNIIVAGISCYARCLDYERFRKIADATGAYVMSDMAHVAGLIAAKHIPSPFKYSDIVTTTTHKTLRGPRAAVIFFRKGVRQIKPNGEKVLYDLEERINFAVFPSIQGGPNNNNIAGIATAMKQAKTPEFAAYQKQVLVNATRLSEGLQAKGYKIVTGGTDVHLIIVDLRNVGLIGAQADFVLEEVGISCNKCSVPGEPDPLYPSGIRLGTPTLTTRGFVERDIDRVVDFIDRALKIARVAIDAGGIKIDDFYKVIVENSDVVAQVKSLAKEVSTFSSKFFLPSLGEY